MQSAPLIKTTSLPRYVERAASTTDLRHSASTAARASRSEPAVNASGPLDVLEVRSAPAPLALADAEAASPRTWNDVREATATAFHEGTDAALSLYVSTFLNPIARATGGNNFINLMLAAVGVPIGLPGAMAVGAVRAAGTGFLETIRAGIDRL